MPNTDNALFWPSLLFCLGIHVITYVIRKIFEGIWPKIKERTIWRELALPICPILVGLAFALMAHKYPWPSLVAGAISARVLYGVVCGVFSGWVYARFRSYLKMLEKRGNEKAVL